MKFKIPVNEIQSNENKLEYNGFIKIEQDPVKSRVYKIFILDVDVTEYIVGLSIEPLDLNSYYRKIVGNSMMSYPEIKQIIILNLKNNTPKKIVQNINSYLLMSKIE